MLPDGEDEIVTLLDRHREHLRASALTDETIVAARIYSVVEVAEAGRLLGWQGAGPAPSLAFPYFDRGGNVIATILRPDDPYVRTDGRAPKYESPLGELPRIYFPPIISADRWTDPSVPLLLIEGIKKALAAAQLGFAAASAQGVTVFHDIAQKRATGNWLLHPDFAGIPLSGRTVCIVFDGGDTTTNPAVILAEAQVARMMLDAGANVFLARIPSPDSKTKVGLDDYVLTQPDPKLAIENLLRGAIPADPISRARTAMQQKSDDAILALVNDLSFAAALDPRISSRVCLDLACAQLKPRVSTRAVMQKIEAFGDKLRSQATYASSANESQAPEEGTDLQGNALILREDEPSQEYVTTEILVEEIVAEIRRFAVLPTAGPLAIALWVLHAYAFDVAQVSPILILVSPTKRCGKTTVLLLLQALVPKPQFASNVTSAVLFRMVDRFRPTLLVDEGDTFLRDNEEMRGILNSGHTRGGAKVVRCVGEDHEPREFSTWAPKAIALIGKAPDTLTDRSIGLRMRRRGKREAVERLRLDRVTDQLEHIRRKAKRWATDHMELLRGADPNVPTKLDDRASDNWRPLLAIADLAGDAIARKAREAALELSGAPQDADEPASCRLLSDIRAMFTEKAVDRMSSADIIASVCHPESPWTTFVHGKPITQMHLARLLRPFGIQPKTCRIQEETPRGYLLEDFRDAFDRYLSPEDETAKTSSKSPGKSEDPSRNGTSTVAFPFRNPNGWIDEDVSGVAVREQPEHPSVPDEDAEARFLKRYARRRNS